MSSVERDEPDDRVTIVSFAKAWRIACDICRIPSGEFVDGVDNASAAAGWPIELVHHNTFALPDTFLVEPALLVEPCRRVAPVLMCRLVRHVSLNAREQTGDVCMTDCCVELLLGRAAPNPSRVGSPEPFKRVELGCGFLCIAGSSR
jgi:hypothetical protein